MKDKFNDYLMQFKSNRLFKKTMKSYFIIACMVFLGYALVMVFNVYNAAITQLTAAEQKMLSQSETTNDFILRDINSTASSVFENELVAIDAVTKPYDPLRSFDISALIDEMKNRTSAIYKVYFFNFKDDCIYTADAPVYNKENFPDKELLELISSSSKYLINHPHMLKYEDELLNTYEERVLVSLYKFNDTGCMAVMVNSDTFNSMVNTDFNNQNQSMMILQSNGVVLSSTDPDDFGKDLSDDGIIQKINKSGSGTGYFNKSGRIYCYKKSNTLNSLYICSFRSSSVIVSYIWQFIVIIAFAMLLLILYFISSFEISKSVFRPFRKLRADVLKILDINVSNQSDDMGTELDLARIAKNLTNIKAEYDKMQETENLYSETKRNELVYKIMTGAYNYDEQELYDYDIRLSNPSNTMILVRLDNTKLIARANIGLIQYGIANSGIELFTQDNMTAYSTTFSDEYDVIFLVNHSGSFDTKYLSMLQKYASNAFNVTISVAYDTSDNSLDSISQMYSNVKYAMQYRIVRGHGSVICYSDLLSDISDKYDYPAKWEKIVMREINLKNESGAKDAIDGFINELKTMPYTYIVIHASMLAMSIMSHIPKNPDERRNMISDEFMHVETIDDIRDRLIAKCKDAMISASDVGITDKHMMIANAIEDYINKNYTDPNLSIDTIASVVNKSANYTRNIFKQHKDISISEYISKKRFEEVKRMLVETNLTAQTIANKVGMNPGSYFYTAFKKYTGCTPDQYRKNNLSRRQLEE